MAEPSDETVLKTPRWSECWRRFGARCFDYVVFSTVLEYLGAPGTVGWYFVYWAAWVPIEAAAIYFFGTTIGRMAFGIALKWRDGSPTYGLSLKRAAFVWVLGVGAGIPLVSLAAIALAFARRYEHGATRWDVSVGTTVQITNRSWWQPIAAVILAVVAQAPLR